MDGFNTRSYEGLTTKELQTKLQDIIKRITYANRTFVGASALPQMRLIQQALLIELRSRMESKKNDMYNKYWPTNSKIIGEEDYEK